MRCLALINTHRRRLVCISACACLAVFALASCSDDDPGRPTSDEFSFSVVVTDTLGNPVPNLEVSVWSFLSLGWPGPVLAGNGSARKTLSVGSTTIPVSLADAADVDLDILDLTGKTIEPLVDGMRFPKGSLFFAWNPKNGVTNGVYRYRLTASDTLTGETLFEDGQYCVMSSQDRSDRVAGYTDARGIFRTDKETLFPGLFDLPTMTATNEQGSVVAAFDVLDSVRITVVDTANRVGMTVDRIVGGGANTINLLWKEPSPVRAPDAMPSGAEHTSSDPPQPFRSRHQTQQWALHQNYPNPFW